MIINGNSDLLPAILAVNEMHPQKEIRVAFPPTNERGDLKKAPWEFYYWKEKLESSLLPEAGLVNKYGEPITKPKECK